MSATRLATRTAATALATVTACLACIAPTTGATGTLGTPGAPPAVRPATHPAVQAAPLATRSALSTAPSVVRPVSYTTTRPAARTATRTATRPAHASTGTPARRTRARSLPAAQPSAERVRLDLHSLPTPTPTTPAPGPAPTPTSDPTSTPTASARVPVGFSPGFALMEDSLSDLRLDLDQMRDLGITRVRVDLSWGVVENVRGRFDWSQPDRVFTEAHQRGIQVLAVVGYQPDWAQRYDSAGRPLPVDQAGFARFVQAAVTRYHDDIGAWEIWNEPNLQRFWVAPPNVAQYARLVNAVAPIIHAGDPGAPVVVGAMSPANDVPDKSTLSPMTFLDGIYAGVPLANFDAVSVHPYSYPAMPTGAEEWNTFFRMNRLHATMVDHGDGDTRLWITEYGAPTGTASDAVSAQTQATMLVAGIREARRRDYVGPMYLYSLRDTAVNPADRESNFGLLTYDRRTKPAYNAVLQELRTS